MKPTAATTIRAFDGSLADAEGLLAVERATFDESPYSAEQVRAMLTEGSQRAWLALAAGQIVGFVIAFPTYGLGGRVLGDRPAGRPRRVDGPRPGDAPHPCGGRRRQGA